MFCRNCGKDIGDAKFCQYCGKPSGEESKNTHWLQNELFIGIKNKIKQIIKGIGQEKLLNLIAWISAIMSIVIRIVNNEIKTVYDFLTQEDYFVVSENGRKYMLIIIVFQIVISLLLYGNAKKERINISKTTIVLFFVSLVIQILATVVKLPAPY